MIANSIKKVRLARLTTYARIAVLLVAALMQTACFDTKLPNVTVSSVKVTWYGVYGQQESANADTAHGRTRRARVECAYAPPKENHSRIPAKLGVGFGFGYQLETAETRGLAKLRMVYKFPEGGIVDPATKVRRTVEESEVTLMIGEKDLFVGYGFDYQFERAPGTWTFEIWQGDRKLVEQKFEVYCP